MVGFGQAGAVSLGGVEVLGCPGVFGCHEYFVFG